MEIQGIDSALLADKVRAVTEHGRLGGLAENLSGRKPEEAAKMLEGLFATILVKEMRRTSADGFFGSGPGADIFEGWLDQHLGEALAREEALGLAGMVRATLGAEEPPSGGGEAGA